MAVSRAVWLSEIIGSEGMGLAGLLVGLSLVGSSYLVGEIPLRFSFAAFTVCTSNPEQVPGRFLSLSM